MIETHPELPIMIPEGPDLARKAVDLLGSEESEMKARALSLTGEHTEAIRISKLILESNPESKSWRLMAKVLESAGEVDRAQQCREKAKKIDGESSDELNISPVIVEDTAPILTAEPDIQPTQMMMMR